jgi:hypothetical protein
VEVLFHPGAEKELARLPDGEKLAMDHAVEKLEALGPRLPYPHQSDVKGADRLRELRPRAGRSPWRALYRQVGSAMVIAAIGPEAKVNRRGFAAAVKRAEARLAELEEPRRRRKGARG